MPKDEFDPDRISTLGAALFATMLIGIGSAIAVHQLTSSSHSGGQLLFAFMCLAVGIGYWGWALSRRVIDLRGRTGDASDSGPDQPPR
jgi:hypothetical protein